MDKKLWHYGYWQQFGNWVYGSTLNQDHVMDKGKMHHQEEFIKIEPTGNIKFYYPEGDDMYYMKCNRGGVYYLVPKKFTKAFPINIKESIPMKLKEKDTHVWQYVTRADSLAIPQKRTMGLKQFLTEWNPMEHTNPHTWYLSKMICLAQGLKLGVCGDFGAGKNANLIIRRHITRNTIPKVKATTKAKLYRELYYNDYVNLDEITSWSKTVLGEVEDLIADFGDESPDIQKHATDANKSLELMNNVLYKSLTFTFNPYHAKDNPYTFEEKFRNPGKIKDRYPIIYLEGNIKDNVAKPSNAEAESKVAQNLESFKSLASEFMYWTNNYDKHMHGFDREKIKFTRRHKGNIAPLIDVVDAFCETQEEFDSWINYIEKCRDLYKEKSQVYNEEDYKTQEEKIE